MERVKLCEVGLATVVPTELTPQGMIGARSPSPRMMRPSPQGAFLSLSRILYLRFRPPNPTHHRFTMSASTIRQSLVRQARAALRVQPAVGLVAAPVRGLSSFTLSSRPTIARFAVPTAGPSRIRRSDCLKTFPCQGGK